MTTSLLILLIHAQVLFTGPARIDPPPSGAPSYLLEENADGTGTPSGWTDASGSNWDYTATILQGTQSWSGSDGGNSWKAFTAQTTVEAYALVRLVAYPTATGSYLSIRDSSGTALAIFRVGTSGAVTVYANGLDSSAAVGTISTGTTYHVWLRFVSSGTCTVAFSTDGTRPTSGDNFISRTGASGTAERVYINAPTAASSLNTIYDRILVLNGTIGNSP